MNIQEAKQEIIHTLQAYLRKDDAGNYLFPAVHQRPILLMGPPGIGKTAIMEQVARRCGVGLVAYTITHHTRQSAVGLPDVDISITTRELADMIRRAGIMFNELPDEEFDPIFGIASGAGHIFGATGGVMEAALRTVSELVTGKELARPEFQEVRGIAGIKEAEYDLAGTKVTV